MRYYQVDIQAPDGQPVYPLDVSGQGGSLSNQSFATSLLPNGNDNPAALDVELDLPVAAMGAPDGDAGAFVRIWGLSVQDLSQALSLTGNAIKVSGGFTKGLPLNNPAQAGVLVWGQVWQAFGNWVGTEMTLDLQIMAGSTGLGTEAGPKNFSFDWKAGTPLSSAIQTTLSAALPGVPQNIQISSSLILDRDQPGFYYTLPQFARYLYGISKSITGNPITIDYSTGTVNVSDGSTQPSPKQIAFQDMIGQPTWIANGVIQAKFAMRADIHIGDILTLPPSLVTTTAQAQVSNTLIRNQTTFSGNWQVQRVHHFGRFRAPTADAWATVVDMATVPTGS